MSNDFSNAGIEIIRATSAEQIVEVRRLFRAYAESLDFDLCFQGFEEELAGLPGKYAPPDGELLLAAAEGRAVGCVALRNLGEGACEMKRLYMLPAWRGRGLGRKLVEAILRSARDRGYVRMRLDTIAATMPTAVKLYLKMGFYEIPPYTHNPIAGAVFFEVQL